MNGGVCTERVASPSLAPDPTGRKEPHADPLPCSSPGREKAPRCRRKGILTWGKTQQEKPRRVGLPLLSSSPLSHAHP